MMKRKTPPESVQPVFNDGIMDSPPSKEYRMFFLELPSGSLVHSFNNRHKVIARTMNTPTALGFKTEKQADAWIEKHAPITVLGGLKGVKVIKL
jgi:hypothetical protein